MGGRGSIVCFPAFRVRCRIHSGLQVASFCISKADTMSVKAGFSSLLPSPSVRDQPDRFYFKVASRSCRGGVEASDASDFLVKEIDRSLSAIDAVDA